MRCKTIALFFEVFSTVTFISTTVADGYAGNTLNAAVPYTLDVNREPDVFLGLQATSPSFQIKRSDTSKDFSILVHLTDCNLPPGVFITLDLLNGTSLPPWNCSELEANRKGLENLPRNNGSALRQRDGYASNYPGPYPLEVLEGVEEVVISLRYEDGETAFNSSGYALIVANLYKDIQTWDTCPENMLDCNVIYFESDCRGTCRSNKPEFMEWFCEDDHCRCIPAQLACNGRLNCGWNRFEEEVDYCSPADICNCGNIGMFTIVGICIGWIIVVLSSFGFYRCMRTSAGLVAAFDMAVSLSLLVTWNFGVEMIPDHVVAVLSPSDIRISKLASTGIFGIFLLLALWLFVGTRQAKDPAMALRFSRVYLLLNVVILLIYQIAVILYVVLTAHSQMYEDGRLWISAVTCTTRLTCIFGVLDYIKILHKRWAP